MNTEIITARDNTKIACFRYPTKSIPSSRMFFLHGYTLDSQHYHNIAKACAEIGCEVILVDWRGHGQSEGESGHCAYVGQLEDDIADVLEHYQQPPLPTLLGGHCAGATICLRYAERYGQDNIAGCFLISPAFDNILEARKFDSNTSKRQFLLNFCRNKQSYNPAPEQLKQHQPIFKNSLYSLAIALPFLRDKKVLFFPNGSDKTDAKQRTMNYSSNMVRSISISNYAQTFRQINTPILLICGDHDETIHANFLHTISHWHLAPNLDKSVEITPNANHISIIDTTSEILSQWVMKRWPEQIETSSPIETIETKDNLTHRKQTAADLDTEGAH